MNYEIRWHTLCDEAKQELGNTNIWRNDREYQVALIALKTYKLECFTRELYSNAPMLLEAHDPADLLRLYLINKHHWTLETVDSIEYPEGFHFLLGVELSQMTLNAEEARPVRSSMRGRVNAELLEPHFADQAES
ncbi:hypothetical protein ACIQVE_07180 [Pseudomonas sp. NPDC098747]|uniref:hypothetical protein n=1 Tax=Pseudomonas sp. NPDC098747 TaxID=3364487 RepID=UPI00383AF030